MLNSYVSVEDEAKAVVDDDVESEEVKEQLCTCDTTSVENLIKGISKKLSNIKRMILRNKIAQFLLHLSATLSKVMELCPLRHFIKFKHLQN